MKTPAAETTRVLETKNPILPNSAPKGTKNAIAIPTWMTFVRGEMLPDVTAATPRGNQPETVREAG
jgi:hypothetical protein